MAYSSTASVDSGRHGNRQDTASGAQHPPAVEAVLQMKCYAEELVLAEYENLRVSLAATDVNQSTDVTCEKLDEVTSGTTNDVKSGTKYVTSGARYNATNDDVKSRATGGVLSEVGNDAGRKGDKVVITSKMLLSALDAKFASKSSRYGNKTPSLTTEHTQSSLVQESVVPSVVDSGRFQQDMSAVPSVLGATANQQVISSASSFGTAETSSRLSQMMKGSNSPEMRKEANKNADKEFENEQKSKNDTEQSRDCAGKKRPVKTALENEKPAQTHDEYSNLVASNINGATNADYPTDESSSLATRGMNARGQLNPEEHTKLRQRLKVLKEENKQLKKRQLCRHCHKKPVALTFLPCGHFCYCKECGSTFHACPVCRKTILADVNTIVS